ncbi:DUF488 domain-containing protein [Edaphobacter paludis]|uniref:DUF488 domain-containing protein n=1 Tax=Edaphobacter paludis TaxID=3035702 RepID=A0AAU7D0W5_9BACT
MMTIGHSTLPLEVFIQALKDNSCNLLVDVRSIPRSRHNPQFEQPTLFAALEAEEIAAVWNQALGGRRRTHKDSFNRGWRNTSFRGYADYMQTPEFSAQIDWLMALPNLDATVVMCAEAVPWRCHRSLISDAVLARGGIAEDIFVPAKGSSFRKPHELTKFARVEGSRVWYPSLEEEANPTLFD